MVTVNMDQEIYDEVMEYLEKNNLLYRNARHFVSAAAKEKLIAIKKEG